MIHALLFDMGNVLVHFSHERMCEQIGRLVGWSGEETRAALMESGLFAAYESGQKTTEEMHAEFAALLPRDVSAKLKRSDLERAASDIFWRNKSIEPVIDRLMELGYPLVLVSNTCDMHIRWVEKHFRVVRHFKRRALSFEVKSAKPDSRIFEHAAELARCHPRDCFFADDTPGHVEAAKRLGFDAVVFQDTAQLLTDLIERDIHAAP